MSTIATLSDLHLSFSDYLNEETPPASSDPRYGSRTRLFNRGQEDLAKRYFFKSLLKADTLSLRAGVPTYALLSDFEKPNGLRYFAAGEIVYTDPFEKEHALTITRNFTTGGWQVTLMPPPSTDVVANYSYFATPPRLSAPESPLLVDGDAVLYFALKEYFFQNEQMAKWQVAVSEYENRIEELIRANAIEPPGSLQSTLNYEKTYLKAGNEKDFYSGVTRINL